MKKTSNKRLSLKTESIRQLTPDSLLAVQGGLWLNCCSAAMSQKATCSTAADMGCTTR